MIKKTDILYAVVKERFMSFDMEVLTGRKISFVATTKEMAEEWCERAQDNAETFAPKDPVMFYVQKCTIDAVPNGIIVHDDRFKPVH